MGQPSTYAARLRLLLAFFIGTQLIVFAETQAAQDLRARLQASEAARVLQEKRVAALQQQILTLTAAGAKSTVAVQQASRSATTSAEANTAAIQQASDSANSSAEVARIQADQLRGMLTSSYRSTVAIEVTTITVFVLGLIGAWLKDVRDHRWAVADSEARIKVEQIQTAKLNQIHTLVNSDMTAAMESELGALRSNLVLLQAEEVRQLTPSMEAEIMIKAAKGKITELAAQLDDRRKQTVIADIEVKEGYQ